MTETLIVCVVLGSVCSFFFGSSAGGVVFWLCGWALALGAAAACCGLAGRFGCPGVLTCGCCACACAGCRAGWPSRNFGFGLSSVSCAPVRFCVRCVRCAVFRVVLALRGPTRGRSCCGAVRAASCALGWVFWVAFVLCQGGDGRFLLKSYLLAAAYIELAQCNVLWWWWWWWWLVSQ